ncbi:oxysterol-binding protein-related protein 1D [Mercurialis annua]|uniref:oxysterol-binding protein-related protein 1D n=1 Tax=Mercurialis annua TaxID=3986 RepID=UPI00215E6A53|nr:oxysterol-binding protein-related protein 1D [Mercurialis annua]
MNPLCCIAPVSIDKDRANPNPVVAKSVSQNQLGHENFSTSRSVYHASKPSFSAQVSSVSTDLDRLSGFGNHHDFASDELITDGARDYSLSSCGVGGGGGSGGSVAGILYKWVNYGKGWRPRWFLLEDGVLSYYKIHGPYKILTSPAREKDVGVIGDESVRYLRKANWNSNSSGNSNRFEAKQCKPFGEIHLKVSSVRASKSDDKRLTIFTGTKTLHLRCISREDRAAWLESLQAAKDLFPRLLSSNDFSPYEDVVVSTEKLRLRLLQEGIGEPVIKNCESIMLSEVSELQNQLKALQRKHIILLDTLRQLEAEKIELETTVVDETKERESYCGQANRRSDFYSVMSDGSLSDSEADNESQDGADVETDEDDGAFFDTNDFLSSDALRSASYRSREATGNGCIYDKDPFFSDRLHGALEKEIRTIKYPYVKRRDNLPEPKEKEKPVGLWSIIKENIGKDLSGVCLPVYFNEPLSSLQKCFEDLEYSHLVDRALAWGKQGNDLMRILNIAAFAVSGYASTEGRQCKPFNPLLGETYEADYPDKGLRFFSEKVSHHPMIVACHCEGRGWKFWADSNIKGKFWGRSIQLDPVGILTLQFEDGDTYQWSKVTTSIYNIILGKLYCDHYGTMRIKGGGRYSCKLKFKEQSIIDRNPHQVHGFVQDNSTGEKVAMLVGKWDEAMYYVLGDPTTKPKGYDPMTEAVLLWERDKAVNKTRYNLTPFALTLNELTPGLFEKLPPTDSRLRPDQRHLENGEYELANSEKLRLEQLQRQARKLQERGWQPRWFRKDEEGCYRYIEGYWEAREKKKWDMIPDIFGQKTDLPSSLV